MLKQPNIQDYTGIYGQGTAAHSSSQRPNSAGNTRARTSGNSNTNNNVYQNVEIKYSFAEPTTDEGKHLTIINGTTDVKITSEQLIELTAKVAAVRNFIIN